ncbi:MAG TPA: 30S ribosomal protein S1 [Planctomycetota bacterium]|nr:30S ribosomal protein S1 [Planctomycetota bacterium]
MPSKHPLVKEIERQQDQIEKELLAAMESRDDEEMERLVNETIKDFEAGSILDGIILDRRGDQVIVDIGYKSEGIINVDEFDLVDESRPGNKIEVLLESVEDDSGMIVLSKRKADRIRGWERVISHNAEGDIVKGRVTHKIKGGLLVDIGVPVFLPASQVSIRRTGDIGEYLGKDIECKIIKIDKEHRNIVVSRRRLIEERREEQKKALLGELKVGEIRKGTVKSITDFGAFVDLGGIDGLLHITDMSWGRISHPSEMVAIDDVIEVKILSFDAEKEKISLGLKQRTESPWSRVEEKYPIGNVVKGQVVNIMSYGAFIKLEEGVEGLVHISEMSWTRRLNHPSEMVAIGDTVEVAVLGINKEKQEISLGMKQVEVNPWTLLEQKYPPGTIIKGKVRNMTNYGAFIEIEEGIDGLLHISDMSWTKKIKHPSEMVKKGEKIEAVVLSVDQDKKRVALGLKQLHPDPWEHEIPMRYKVGDVVKGKATKFTNFGVFIELEEGLEGLLHISELADRKLESPEEIVKSGEELDLRVIRVDTKERKIGLSLKRAQTDELVEIVPGEYSVGPAPGPAFEREHLEKATRRQQEEAAEEHAEAEEPQQEEAPAEHEGEPEAESEPPAEPEAEPEPPAEPEAEGDTEKQQ